MSASTEIVVRPAVDASDGLLACLAVSHLAFDRLRLLSEALGAEQRAQEAADALHLSQAAGTALEDDAERLYGEAEDAWKRAATGWAKAWFVPEEIRDGVRQYAPRPVVNAAVPLHGAWDDPSGLIDWGQSRGAA